ncbi:MAG: hypothetical protein ACPLRM_02625 [Anaerolineae bacterium]
MQPLVALLICLGIFALGDAISTRTKAMVSSLFVASVLFLAGYWTFFPKDITTKATLQATGALAIPLLITHMGSLMSVKELVDQWRTVVAAVSAVVGIGIVLATLGVMVFGKTIALVAAPPIAGGVVASLIMTEAAKAKGAADMAVLATLLLVVQGFFGYPIASACLLKEAKRVLGGMGTSSGPEEPSTRSEAKKLIPPVPEKYRTPAVYLFKLAVGAWISVYLAGFTRGIIHQYVMCLIIGVILSEIGFLERDIMTKANSYGYLMIALLAIVMANLANASPSTLVRLLWPLFGTLVLGVGGIVLFTWLVHKPLGLSREMALAIGTTALYGFPGTYILSHEAAKACASNEEERQVVLHHILPKMLVGGFCTVTITSVILAGILAKYL